MTPNVLKRFIFLMAILTVGGFSFWMGWRYLVPSHPGDYETRRGGQLLASGDYEEAIEEFNAALKLQPNHRGALQGRATANLQLGRLQQAEDEFSYLIKYLKDTLEEDDDTGRGVLFSAYANRGTIKDREGRYKEALDDYIAAIKTDRELADGPGFLNRMIYYDRKPSSVLDRAKYLYKQLQLPEDERVLRVPELDDKQRMYQP